MTNDQCLAVMAAILRAHSHGNVATAKREALELGRTFGVVPSPEYPRDRSAKPDARSKCWLEWRTGLRSHICGEEPGHTTPHVCAGLCGETLPVTT